VHGVSPKKIHEHYWLKIKIPYLGLKKGINEMNARKIILTCSVLATCAFWGLYAKRKFYDPTHRFDPSKKAIMELLSEGRIQEGDLIFQTSQSGQSKAIQLATKSKYSHCGIIYKDGTHYFVFEAVQPVKQTPLEKWVARGQGGKFVIKRLKNAEELLNQPVLSKMKQVGSSFMGKNYDLTFEWSDDKIYCSELIWKIYQRSTGLEIGKLQKLQDFDLTQETVKIKMKERYGHKIPFDEPVISPSAIFDSELLETVASN
jgi:uncharacterized protein YycO